MDFHPPLLLLDRLGRRGGLLAAGACLLAIAIADNLTGYSLRLSPLYLAPITIAAWVGGIRIGMAFAVVACLAWLFSFRTEHLYLHPWFYFWEALSMFTGFVVVVWLAVRLHKALSQADERFVRVLEEMRAAVYVANEKNDSFLYANPEMQRLDERIGQLTPQTFEQDFVGETALGVGEARSAETGFVSRQIKNTRNGHWYILQEGPIPWGKQRQVKLKVLTDITEQKNAQRLREMQSETAHQSSRVTTLAEIASTLAHEINQPLMVIATYTDACQRLLAAPAPDHQEVIRALSKCHAQAVRAAAIIERLREFIRQRQHQPATCDVRSLVGEALEISRPILDAQQVTVDNTQVAADLLIVADRLLLVQVLANLIRNAVEAMEQTPVARRRLSISAVATAENSVLIAVADCGCGLGSLPLDDMFAPFVTTKGQGLGLGLAISRSLAESHGGRLWASTNADGGATFHLAIPNGRGDA